MVLPKILLPLLCTALSSTAQEFNIGAHINPVLTTPVFSASNPYDRQLHLSLARLDFKLGLQGTVTFGRLAVETGVSFVRNSFAMRQDDFGTGRNGGTFIKALAYGSSLEVPLILKWKVGEHNARLTYTTHLLAGAGYEAFRQGGSGTHGVYGSPTGPVRNAAITTSAAGAPTFDQWINVVAGAEIRAVLRRVGLLEYGMALHVPLRSTGPYTVQTQVLTEGNGYGEYRGEFYPRLAYLDIRLRYYFLNFRTGEGRVRYRN